MELVCHLFIDNWIFNTELWTSCLGLQEPVPDSVIFWSLSSLSGLPCWVVDSNHHLHGVDLYGSRFIVLEQIRCWQSSLKRFYCETCCLNPQFHFQPSLWSNTIGTTHQDQGQWLWPSLHPCLGMPSLYPWFKLQDGQKIPKWNCQPCLGQFQEFSDVHSSLATHICHFSTGYVSPQYYLDFDDMFQIMLSTGNDAQLLN